MLSVWFLILFSHYFIITSVLGFVRLMQGAVDDEKNDILWDLISILGLKLCYLSVKQELTPHLCIF